MNFQTIHVGLAFLRIAFSGMMLTHGIPKMSKLFITPIEFADPLGIGSLPTLILAIIGEVIAPLFVLVGYKTKWATIPTIITMLVAVFVIHLDDPFNKKELGLVYLFAFFAIYLTGGGKYSLDEYLKKN